MTNTIFQSHENNNSPRPRRSARIFHQTEKRQIDSTQERSKKKAAKGVDRSQIKLSASPRKTDHKSKHQDSTAVLSIKVPGPNDRKTRMTSYSIVSCSKSGDNSNKVRCPRLLLFD